MGGAQGGGADGGRADFQLSDAGPGAGFAGPGFAGLAAADPVAADRGGDLSQAFGRPWLGPGGAGGFAGNCHIQQLQAALNFECAGRAGCTG